MGVIDGGGRATGASILSDELVQQLVDAGQVDLLVGLPSFNHAATIGHVAREVHVAFARYFPRERTLLLNIDAGSNDGTVDAVRSASPAEADSIVASHALRTIHRISVPYHGVLGKPAALRTLLTAADLLQARAVVIADPGVCSFEARWIRELAEPVLHAGTDFVAPLYQRHPLDGPLITQLVRPLVRALYGWRLQEPLAPELAFSSRFVRRLLDRPVWSEEGALDGIDLRLALEALADEDVARAEVPLGAHVLDPGRPRPPVAGAVEQIVATVLAGLDRHAAVCRRREGSQSLRRFGDPPPPRETPASLPVAAMRESFERGVRELDPILAEALPADLLDALRAAAGTAGPSSVDDALWARIVYALIDTDRRHAMPRGHVAKAIVPLYLGRAAGFLEREGGGTPATIDAALESLAMEFERQKPAAAGHWPDEGRR